MPNGTVVLLAKAKNVLYATQMSPIQQKRQGRSDKVLAVIS
jgi:hypothetical protein